MGGSLPASSADGLFVLSPKLSSRAVSTSSADDLFQDDRGLQVLVRQAPTFCRDSVNVVALRVVKPIKVTNLEPTAITTTPGVLDSGARVAWKIAVQPRVRPSRVLIPRCTRVAVRGYLGDLKSDRFGTSSCPKAPRVQPRGQTARRVRNAVHPHRNPATQVRHAWWQSTWIRESPQVLGTATFGIPSRHTRANLEGRPARQSPQYRLWERNAALLAEGAA